MYIGTHVESINISIFDAIVHAFKESKANAIQIYVCTPSGRAIKKLTKMEQNNIKKFIIENDIKLFIHASYIMNICQEFNENKWYVHSLLKSLQLGDKIGALGVVVHLGKYTTLDKSTAFNNMLTTIKYVSDNNIYNTKLILETAAGQGTQMCTKIKELSILYDKLDKNKIKICIDTCHIFAAGYDIRTHNGVKKFLTKFDKRIGLENLILLHLNDSKNKLGSHVDRHQNIGYGEIGENLKYICREIGNIPIILETPGNLYKKEIKQVKDWL